MFVVAGGCDGCGSFGLICVEVARFFKLGCGLGCFFVVFAWVSCVVLVFVTFPVFPLCAIEGRLFVGRVGGIANALRTRKVRGAHGLYESPRGNEVDGLPRAASFARDLDRRACLKE